MNLYFAPLEGITGFTYRNAHNDMFGECDEYYAPFINPSNQEKISRKEMKDIFPERNADINLNVQVLTNNSKAFLNFIDKIKKMGYYEVNINLGCPAATVVKKGRGAGFLRDTEILDRFFYEIFSECDIKVSVKTRSGYFSGDELKNLIKVYNKYPLSRLIIHPRAREDFYNGVPDIDIFTDAYNASVNKVCYNGDIYTVDDYNKVINAFPELDGVMLGRGVIRNPALFREIHGGEKITTSEMIEFSKRLMNDYFDVLKSEKFTLYKLKEVWVYMLQNFPEEKKTAKAAKKANSLTDFMSVIECLPELKY